MVEGVGAYIMGRKMFGGGAGAWDEEWKGWWGDEPPYHTQVFVLTHQPRQPLSMLGGTTFTFVTDGIASALRQAQAAAGDQAVSIAGGASTIRQYLAAGSPAKVKKELTGEALPASARRAVPHRSGAGADQGGRFTRGDAHQVSDRETCRTVTDYIENS